MDERQEQIMKELFQWMIKTENDPKYQNETRPALYFVDEASNYLGIQIKHCEENKENSAPDFFLTLENGILINLEVTVFSESFVEKHNSFFRMFEQIARPLIERNLNKLPPGRYMLYYIPGSEKNASGLDVPSFKYKAGKEQIEKQLAFKIPEWLENYSSNRNGHCTIEDKKGNQVGKITISKLAESEDRQFFLFPQEYSRLAEWSEDELRLKLQERVNKKEAKYANLTIPKNHEKDKWWLLISDIKGKMGTQNVDFNLSKLGLESNYFSKIFLIQNILTEYKIIEFRTKEASFKNLAI